MYIVKVMTVFQKFTFHYVSIKSKNLFNCLISSGVFTFHYVSIKSSLIGTSDTISNIFTFHYVSIKSDDKKSYAVT